MLDIKTIPVHLKNMLINAFLLPVWYLAIYIFSPSLYGQNDIILTTSVCFTITLASSYFAMIIIVTFRKTPFPLFDFNMINFAFFIQLFCITLLISIGYLSNILFGCKFAFYGFVITYFILLFTILFILTTYFLNFNEEKQQN